MRRKITIPSYTCPIEFEALNLKLSGCVFKIDVERVYFRLGFRNQFT